MSSGGQNSNNNQAGVIPAGDPNQIIPPGTVGTGPQSSLNPNVAHTKADLDNHANQLNPNNPRYAGHQERLAAMEVSREAAMLHQQAQEALQYANQMETAAIQAQVAAGQLIQEASMYAQHANIGLNNRGSGRGRGRGRGGRGGGGGSQGGDNNDNQEDEGGYDDVDYEEGQDEEQGTSNTAKQSIRNDSNQGLPQRQPNQA
ncbi:hypothetical protein I4U23_020386 [Adineta vaga]|nr:hypothetical protein I4U23_020386 [Adineta vaga]